VKSEDTTKKTNKKKNTVCPICGGIGYLRRDVPIDDPNFGVLELCECQKKSREDQITARLLEISNLSAFKEKTFETFNIHSHDGKTKNATLEFAFNTAKNYAAHLNGWLLLMGGFGSGKTHLAASIANQVVTDGTRTLFLTVPDLLDWLRSTFSSQESTYQNRFDEIRNMPFLVLDDFGTQNATDWAREKLYQIINYRYINQLPTVFTTNLNINAIEDRISSRLQDRELVIKVQIDASDYRNPIIDQSMQEISPISSLAYTREDRIFSTFSARKNERLSKDEQADLDAAFFAAQKFAEHPGGWIVFMGASGTGKTHLAVAIGKYRQQMGDNPLFSEVQDLLDHLRATFSPTSLVTYDKVFNQVRFAELLILDDFRIKNATSWSKEKLFQLLNFRYESNLPTVITTAETLEDIDPYIRTRFLDDSLCHIYKLIAPSYPERNSRQR